MSKVARYDIEVLLAAAIVAMTMVLPSYAQSITTANGTGKGSIIRVIKDRAASINDYYITGEHCTNTFRASMLPEAHGMIEEITKQEHLWLGLSMRDIKDQLQKIHRLHGMGDEWSWGQFATGAAAGVVRQDRKWASGLEMIDYQNDRMYFKVRPTSYQKQVDVYGKQGYHGGIGIETFLPPAVPTAIRGDALVRMDNSGGYLVEYVTEIDTEGITELDKRLMVRHRTAKKAGQLVGEEWYLVPAEVDKYRIPRVVIVANPQPDGLVLSCYLIDRIGLGSEAAASYVVTPEMPRQSIFVDHRVSPSSVSSLPDSVMVKYAEKMPVDELYKSISDYWSEQKRLMETPLHPAVDPFSVNKSAGIAGLFWMALGGFFVVIFVAYLGYRIFRRHVA